MQEEIIGDHQCGFQQIGSITDHIVWICKILETDRERERERENTMRQCMEFKEAYDSVRWDVRYNILSEFGIPMKW